MYPFYSTRAAQLGHRDVVQVLLQYGANPQVNPLTKYSPLYIACFEGHKDTVEVLLKVIPINILKRSVSYFVLLIPKYLQKYPELIQHTTAEKWLPTHACCLQGHYQILDLLLKFDYPSGILKKYTDKSGLFEYEMPFDVNAKDVSGNTIG